MSRWAIGLAVLAGSCHLSTKGDVVAQWTHTGQTEVGIITEESSLAIGMKENGGPLERFAVVTPHLSIPVGIDANDRYAGATFYFDPDPVFRTLLTNGKNDQFDLRFGFPESTRSFKTSEAEAFFGDATGANGIDIDVDEYLIRQFGIRIESMEVTHDFTVPRGRTILDITETVLVEGTRRILGDYNGNGQVEQADLDLVLLNWGSGANTPPPGWENVIPLPAGIISQEELDAVLLNWGKTSAGVASASVPEPTASMLVILLLMVITRRASCHDRSTS